MPFALSPGVTVIEKDFSSIIPAVSTSAGATAGVFSWGPVSEPTTVTSEDVLVELFGKPNDSNFKSFFTAANFLSYTNNLIVNRVDTSGIRNAVVAAGGEVLDVTLSGSNSGFKPGHNTVVQFSAPQTSGGVTATGTVVLSGGTITGITITTGGSGYTSTPTVTISAPEVEGGQTARATATVVNGVVTAITLTSGYEGSGYLNAPTITIDAAPQGGANAAATASVATSSITKINITNGGSGYTSAPTVTITASNTGSVGAVVVPSATAVLSSNTGVKIRNTQHYLSSFRGFEQSVYGMFAAKYPGTLGNGIQIILVDNAVWTWAQANSSNATAKLIVNSFAGAPGTSAQAKNKIGASANDELHVLVLDSSTGTWTGTPGSVLEKFSYLSKLKDVTRSDGTNLYFRDAINSGSKYLWVLNTPSSVQINDPQNTDWNISVNNATSTTNLRDLKSTAQVLTLSGGADDYTMTSGALQSAYDLFLNSDLYDISLIAVGDVDIATANYVIGNIAEVRRDCVVFISPRDDDGPIITSGAAGVTAIKAYKDSLMNSTYAVVDSGWKYQYDRYNDQYRWIPLNGDMAGLCARTDYTADPWFSPGGFTRGQIKNVVKLGFNPGQVERDNLYKEAVNPVVTFPGQGTVLFGDKTFTSKPSAFDRINVRRLFIVLEKAVATAAKFQLFEFNDDFTRAQFRNLVEPFLRNVQGRRGIIDFRVKCDATNNTGEVIDRNEFVASIFIKPNRSINFITLNFVAARSSVSFDEIGG